MMSLTYQHIKLGSILCSNALLLITPPYGCLCSYLRPLLLLLFILHSTVIIIIFAVVAARLGGMTHPTLFHLCVMVIYCPAPLSACMCLVGILLVFGCTR
ncbi:unnamed protein product [Choristocarpus tenellus]